MNFIFKTTSLITKVGVTAIIFSAFHVMANVKSTTSICGVNNIPLENINRMEESSSTVKIINDYRFQENGGGGQLLRLEFCMDENKFYLVTQGSESIVAYYWDLVSKNTNNKSFLFSQDMNSIFISNYAEYDRVSHEFNVIKIKNIKKCQSSERIIFIDLLMSKNLAEERASVVRCLSEKK